MFGLSTKEMLAMSDKQLNQITSLKKLAPYRHDADVGVDYKDKARSQRMAGRSPDYIYTCTSARHVIHRMVYQCSPRHTPNSVPVLATSSVASCTLVP